MGAGRRRIVFIPGKNPKPMPEHHRSQLWRCLVRGVEQVDPDLACQLADDYDCFSLVSWNGLYYQQTKPIDEDLPWIDALLARTGPDARDIMDAVSWRLKWARLLYTIVDAFPFLIKLVPDPAVRATVAETARYFENRDEVGSRVREMLKAPLRHMFVEGERVLVIGHSMGSVIAYDALWELSRAEHRSERIDVLLTLGSPLGMRFVQRRLIDVAEPPDRRYPANIRCWWNVASEGDLTAIDPYLANDFRLMIERGLVGSIQDWHRGVYNYFRNQDGLNVHRSYGYLVQPAVGRLIADWWAADA